MRDELLEKFYTLVNLAQSLDIMSGKNKYADLVKVFKSKLFHDCLHLHFSDLTPENETHFKLVFQIVEKFELEDEFLKGFDPSSVKDNELNIALDDLFLKYESDNTLFRILSKLCSEKGKFSVHFLSDGYNHFDEEEQKERVLAPKFFSDSLVTFHYNSLKLTEDSYLYFRQLTEQNPSLFFHKPDDIEEVIYKDFENIKEAKERLAENWFKQNPYLKNIIQDASSLIKFHGCLRGTVFYSEFSYYYAPIASLSVSIPHLAKIAYDAQKIV